MISLKEFAQKLFKEKSVALFMHVHPDGDTIGSTLCLALALESAGVKTQVFCYDKIPAKFDFLPSTKGVKDVFSGEYSAMLSVDCADVSRLGGFSEVFQAHKNTYNFDHHISNGFYANTNYAFDISSNCENVFNLLNVAGITVTSEMAELLLTGVVTDTGNFSHNNVTEKTFETAGKLLSYGANVNRIVYRTFKAQTKARAKLHGLVMSKIRYFLDDRFAVATVFLGDLQSTGATKDETEGFIDFVMGINSVEVGACIMEIGKDKFKISFRSKSADVNAVAGTFGGGGHVLASGCQINSEYEDVVDKIVFAVSKYLQD